MKFTSRNSITFFASTLLIGLITDILLRQPIFGLNFLVLTVIWIAIMLHVVKVKKNSKLRFYIFLSFAVLNTFVVYLRIEPVVQIWSVIITLIALSFMAGMLYADNFMQLTITNRIIESLTGMTSLVKADAKKMSAVLSNKNVNAKQIHISNGVVIAIILGLVFIGLFSSSDTVFQSQFKFIGDAFRSVADWLGQFNIGRIISTIFWAVISGVILLVIISRRSHVKPLVLASRKIYSKNDTTIILSTLSAIFSIFIIIQIKYLFAGGNLPGNLSYADYARKGYGELLLATMLASAVIYSTLAYVKDTSRNIYNTILSNLLVVLNSIVVFSAWRRLSLYESAYGWTMTRFVARLGLICILLGSILLLAWVNKRLTSKQLFGYCWYVVAVVLTAAALLNPIGIITQKNLVERSSREVKLDIDFLNQLSADSLPALCKYAPSLKTNYPDEYKALQTIKSQGNKVYFPPNEINNGLSAHNTSTKNFKQTYYACLK